MVNVKDDYFAVGGTSISAGQLAFKLRKAFGMKAMTGADMFELRTIEAIAKKIDAKKSGGNSKGGSAADDKSKKVPVGPVNWVEPHSSIAQSTLLIQLIPLFIIRPSLTLFRWTVFLTTWSTIFHTLAPSVHWLRHTLHLMVTSTSYEGTASAFEITTLWFRAALLLFLGVNLRRTDLLDCVSDVCHYFQVALRRKVTTRDV